MKTTKNFILLVAILFGSLGAMSQSIVHQNWKALPDSPTHLEVSWTTIQCTPLDQAEIRLFVFNENGNAQTADFTLTISDNGQSDATYTVSGINLTGGESIQADCGTTHPANLVTNVPAGFDPKTLTISITYN